MNISPGAGFSFSNTFNSRALLVIEGHDIQYWIKEMDLPDITTDHIEVPRTPQSFKVAGNILKYGDLRVTFFVDDYLNVYYRLYDWLKNIVVNGPEHEIAKTNGQLFILNNQLTVINAQFDIKGLLINGIPGISWNTTGNDPITLNIDFKLDEFVPTFKKATLTNTK